jgi:hypothetical protein
MSPVGVGCTVELVNANGFLTLLPLGLHDLLDKFHYNPTSHEAQLEFYLIPQELSHLGTGAGKSNEISFFSKYIFGVLLLYIYIYIYIYIYYWLDVHLFAGSNLL